MKYKVRKMAKSLLKHHCYCPMLLMWTTKTAVCLQTKAIFHHLYGLLELFKLKFMSNTLPIAPTRLLEHISTINSVCKFCIRMTTMVRVGSLCIGYRPQYKECADPDRKYGLK